MPDPNLPYTVDGIAYGELVDDWSGDFFIRSPSTAERKLICAWSNMSALANYLLTANTWTTVQVGATHPIFTRLFVDHVNISPYMGLGTSEGTFTNDYALLKVHYSVLDFNPSAPALIRTDSMEMSAEVMTLPGGCIQFNDGVTKPADDQSITLYYFRYKVAFAQMNVLPASAIGNCLNKISNSTMTIQLGSGASTTFPAGQVLYEGPSDMVKKITSTGAENWTIAHNFLISPINLNAIYNPKRTDTNILARFEVPTSHLKYESANLSTLGV